MKTILRNATLAAAILGSAGMAAASSIPGMRGHDHTGITVPDMKQAVDFFTDVVGCKKAMSFGPFADDKGTFMQDLLGVDPKAVIEERLADQIVPLEGIARLLLKRAVPYRKTGK